MSETKLTDSEIVAKIKECCKDYIDFLESEDYNEDELEDYRHGIFEVSLESIYGKDIWIRVKAAMK